MRILKKHIALLCIVLIGAAANFAISAFAADAKKAPSTGDLAKASQNPVANMISVPFENNATFNNGEDDVFINSLNIKPVVPMGLTENWNLINRAIIPVVYMDSGVKGIPGQTTIGEVILGQRRGPGSTAFTTQEKELGSQFGLGDITYQGFFSPAKPGKWIWGLGPQLNLPTGTDRFTANQWSLGPAAVVLTMPGHWVIGALVSNVWNIGSGYDNAADVNSMTAPYFINYNMEGGWYLSSAPVMTANWEADSGDQWTIPIGGGGGRVFKIGNQHVKMSLAAYYNVDAPNGNDDVWNLQYSCTFLFPKGK